MPLSPTKFTLFKFLLVSYLIYFFYGVLPISDFIYSSQGLFSQNFHFWDNLNVLNLLSSPWQIHIFLWSLIFISLSLLKNLKHYSLLVLTYGWICLNSKIPFYIPPPNIGYLGFLLLVLTQVDTSSNSPKINIWMKESLWWIVALSYTTSGIGKILSSSWTDGTTLEIILNGPLAQDNFITNWLLHSSPLTQKVFTYFALFSELSFLPLIIFKRTRIIPWLLMILTHLGILFLLNIQDIPLGILIIHLFMWDESWVKKVKIKVYLPDNSMKLEAFLKKENLSQNLIFIGNSSTFLIEYNQNKYTGFSAFLTALSFSNGFWIWLRPFILISRKV